MTFKARTLCDLVMTLRRESKCGKHQVASIMVNGNMIVSTGVNGTRAGEPNCCDVWKDKDLHNSIARTEHRTWSKEHEIHAEANMIARAVDNKLQYLIAGSTIAVTRTPCPQCAKLLANHNVKHVMVIHHIFEPVPSPLVRNGIAISHWEPDYEQCFNLTALRINNTYYTDIPFFPDNWVQNLPIDELLTEPVLERILIND